MAALDQNNSDRLITMLAEIGERVESLREQAVSIQEEREKLLELLQDMQSNAIRNDMPEVEREDVVSMTDRLILRCLTVDVSVSTPRNETQEEAYKCVTLIVDKLYNQFEEDPGKHSNVIESYLNACLPEPISSNIDTRFQSKVLGCTVDDQKKFRHKLQNMFKVALKTKVCNGFVQNGSRVCDSSDEGSSTVESNSPENGNTSELQTYRS